MSVPRQRKQDEWERLRIEYKHSPLSKHRFCVRNRVSDKALTEHIKIHPEENWTRDGAGNVAAKTRENLLQEEIEAELQKGHVERTGEPSLVTGVQLIGKHLRQELRAAYSEIKHESIIVEALAAQQTKIILAERQDIGRLIRTVAGMAQELAAFDVPRETTEEVTPAISLKCLAAKAKIAKDLGDTFKTLVGLQRQAFGISDNANGEADKVGEKEHTPNEIAREIAFAMNKLSFTEGEVLPE